MSNKSSRSSSNPVSAHGTAHLEQSAAEPLERERRFSGPDLQGTVDKIGRSGSFANTAGFEVTGRHGNGGSVNNSALVANTHDDAIPAGSGSIVDSDDLSEHHAVLPVDPEDVAGSLEGTIGPGALLDLVGEPNTINTVPESAAAGFMGAGGARTASPIVTDIPAISNTGVQAPADSIGTGIPVVGNAEGVYAPSRIAPPVRRGKVIIDSDVELFSFNYVAGRRSDFKISVGKDDRMDPAEARSRLGMIFEMYGIAGEPHEYLYTFTHALLVAHALNGASVVGPGRATFTVGTDSYAFGDVVKLLGSDARRFYRAFADETAKALLSALHRYDPGDSGSVRLCGQIRSIAVNKRLTQYPYLIHDSADACYRTTATEMAAIAKSKIHVLENAGAASSISELEGSIKA